MKKALVISIRRAGSSIILISSSSANSKEAIRRNYARHPLEPPESEAVTGMDQFDLSELPIAFGEPFC